MKTLTGRIICGLLVIAAIVVTMHPAASARQRNRAPAPPPPRGLYGVNYYTTDHSPSAVAKDLDELKADNVKSLRFTISTWNEGHSVFQDEAVAARAKGFETIWGVATDGPTNPTQWNAFLASINGKAAWANGKIDYFAIGNEEELKVTGGLTVAKVRADLKAKAAEIKGLYPSLKLTYALAAYPNDVTAWLSDTGSFDTVGFNIYGDYDNLARQISANPKSIVSEWNTDNGIQAVRGNQTKWATTLVADRDVLNKYGLKHYIFLLRGNPKGVDETYNYALWSGKTRTQAWTSLIK